MKPSSAPRRLPGVSFAEFNEAMRQASLTADQASDSFHRFIHVTFHHGEGQVPDTCELCRQVLDE